MRAGELGLPLRRVGSASRLGSTVGLTLIETAHWQANPKDKSIESYHSSGVWWYGCKGDAHSLPCLLHSRTASGGMGAGELALRAEEQDLC